MIVYSKNSNLNNAVFGKIQTPIKMVIEHESDVLSKKGGIRDWLFNVEKSNKYGETIITQSEFGTFLPAYEGSGAETDTVIQTRSKFIEHIQFMKEFIVTAEMLEDANYGLAIDAKRRAENFTRAYYKTMNKLCELALITATNDYVEYGSTTINLCASDGKPLFSKNHTWGANATSTGTQSNLFCGDICASGSGDYRNLDAAVLEEGIAELSNRLRNMKDESGEPLGYTADTIILPGNKPKLEQLVKKVCGSEYAPGKNHNDININYGRWNLVILPHWQTSDNRFMVMSSEANKNLSGNMFFNRIPLTISDWVDNHTGNYYWTGRCRFGIGFGSYKHILLAADSETEISNYTKL